MIPAGNYVIVCRDLSWDDVGVETLQYTGFNPLCTLKISYEIVIRAITIIMACLSSLLVQTITGFEAHLIKPVR